MSKSLAAEFYAARLGLESVSDKGKRPVRGKLDSTSYAEMGGSVGSPMIMLRVKEHGIIVKIPLAVVQALVRWAKETGIDTLDMQGEVLNAQDRLL